MTDSPQPYVRSLDTAAFLALAADERHTQRLLDRNSGADRVGVTAIRTPAGGGSPEGLHTHTYDQIFYVLSGTMNVEIDGTEYRAPAGSLVIFPEGTPHRNWNDDEETLHLSITSPAPIPGGVGTIPVKPAS